MKATTSNAERSDKGLQCACCGGEKTGLRQPPAREARSAPRHEPRCVTITHEQYLQIPTFLRQGKRISCHGHGRR